MVNSTNIEQTGSHPKGLWVVSSMMGINCFGFIAINSLLVFYVTSIYHMSTSKAYLLSATYNSLLFTIPVIAGYISSKLGYKRAITIGLINCILGLLIISLHSLQTVYYGLGLYTAGVGFFVISILVMPGKFYAKDDKRRDSGYTLFYIIMNAGFLVGGIISSILAEKLNYHITFIIGAAVTGLALLQYYLGRKLITPFEAGSIDPVIKKHPLINWVGLIVATSLLTALSTYLLKHTLNDDILVFIIVGVVSLLIIASALMQKTLIAKLKLIAFLLLCYISVGFWSLYTLSPNLLSVFVEKNVDRNFFNLFTIPPATYFSFESFFVIVVGAIFSVLWLRLAKKNKNPSTPTKFSLSLLIMGSGFLLMALGIVFANSNGYSSMIWITLCYACMACAELLINPIALSAIGRLAPQRMEGAMMGTWQLFTGLSGVVAGLLTKLAVAPKHETVQLTNPIYQQAFIKIGLMTVALGIIAAILIPFLKKLMATNT